ncbi:MAG: hypothetical protein HC771_24100, partial [Synechococcales cyanobacterium CRU_2_2]|nr:hypothetical protein [Synechococcales cyanobacterium CRU_2_2]
NQRLCVLPPPQSSSVQPPVQPPVQPLIQAPAQSAPPRATDYPIPNLLEQLSLYAKEKLETRAQQRHQKQQRAELEAKVQAWLEALDPLSDDGFWFEQFAQNYSSRLEAAIAFLHPPHATLNPFNLRPTI